MAYVDVTIEVNNLLLNSQDVNGMGYLLHGIPEGLVPPKIKDNATEKTNDHGAFHGQNYYGRRQGVITGEIVAETQLDRVAFQRALEAAFALPRDPAISDGFRDMVITTEDGTQRYAKVKTVNGPVFQHVDGEPWNVFFTITVEFQKEYLEGIDKELPASEVLRQTNFPLKFPGFILKNNFTLLLDPVKTYDLVNDGNYGAHLYMIVSGPVGTIYILNNTTGAFMDISVALLAGEFLHIDTELGRITKIDSIGTQTDQLLNLSTDSSWMTIEPGTNNIQVTDDTVIAPNFAVDFLWADTYINPT